MADPGLTALDAGLAIKHLDSLSATALELGPSGDRVSNMVSKLERSLGMRLFNRTTRGVALMDASRTFVEQVRPAVPTIRDAMTGFDRSRRSRRGFCRSTPARRPRGTYGTADA